MIRVFRPIGGEFGCWDGGALRRCLRCRGGMVSSVLLSLETEISLLAVVYAKVRRHWVGDTDTR